MVRVVVPDEEHSGSPDENTDINIVMSATVTRSPTKSSPRKRNSIAHLKLDEELQKAALAKRRASDYTGKVSEEDEMNLASIVASLRRQNEDLRAKLDHSGSNSNSKEEELRKIAEKECEKLRTTVSKLDRLLNIEREERNISEKKTLELLQNVKEKWHEKEEHRLSKLRSDLQAANTVVQDLEVELMKAQSALDAANRDVEALSDVKSCLKAKLKDCKTKLENTVAKYDEKTKALESLESKYKELEAQNNVQAIETNAKKRRVTMTLNENRIELESIRKEVDRMKDKRSGLEAELHEAQSQSKALQRKVDLLTKEKRDLSKEYEAHLNKCEGKFIKLQSENERLKTENEKLEDKVITNETKLKSKDKKLADLEQILEAIENKIPTTEKMSEAAIEKEKEQAELIEKLQEDFRLQKVELRIAERKANDQKDRISFLREMLKEEREKREKIESSTHSEAEKIAELEQELKSERLEKERLQDQYTRAQSRLTAVKEELESLRKDSETAEEYAEKCEELERKLTKKSKELESFQSVQKHYTLTKNVCYELEDQIKEYERIIEKLESSQEKLLKSNTELKGKSETTSTDLITLKGEVNEYKSMIAFKESRIKDLEEKNKESQKFYESETERWKVRYEDVDSVQKEQSSTMVELKDALVNATEDRDKAHEMNQYLNDQNAKLKEESATLITGIQSLKDSNMMLQSSVRELAEKLARRDQEIERQGDKISKLSEDMQVKEHEHKVTLGQLKKLTQHLPESATPHKSKKDKTTTLANLLLWIFGVQ